MPRRGKGTVILTGSVPLDIGTRFKKMLEDADVSYSDWLKGQVRAYVEGVYDDNLQGKLDSFYGYFKTFCPAQHPKDLLGWLTGPVGNDFSIKTGMSGEALLGWLRKRVELDEGATPWLRKAVGLMKSNPMKPLKDEEIAEEKRQFMYKANEEKGIPTPARPDSARRISEGNIGVTAPHHQKRGLEANGKDAVR